MYIVKKNLSGGWIIVDPDGNVVEGSYTTKEAAQKEADFMNGK